MAASLPIKTTPEDVDFLANYLKKEIGYTPLDKLRAAVPAPRGDARKIETMRYLGLLEVEGTTVKLTEDGRRYAAADAAARAVVLAERLRSIPLFNAALEWMHYGKVGAPTKTDVANYWGDKHAATITDTKGAALTDAAVLFLRFAGAAGAGKFVAAGVGRDTYLKVDSAALEALVTGAAPVPAGPPPKRGIAATQRTGEGDLHRDFTITPDVNVHVEIHIAADASAAAIEEIFKNMRKYLFGGPGDATSEE